MTESNAPPPPPDPSLPPDPSSPYAAPAGSPPAPVGYAGPSASGYPGPYVGPPPDKDSKTMGMLAHLLSIFTGFIGPLVIWLVKKDTSPFVDDQGKEALNFQLTLLIAYIVAFIIACVSLGFLFFAPLVVWIVALVFAIMATMQANNGVAYRYPINIRMIK